MHATRLDLPESMRFLGFVAAGGVSTVCNLGSRYAFELAMPFEAALVGANAVGVLTAFVLNRWFVFRRHGSAFVPALYRFTVVNLVGIALSWAVSVALFRWLFPATGVTWHPDLLAHALGILSALLPNYLLHRAWTFASSLKGP